MKKPKRKAKRKYVLKQQYAVFRLVNFLTENKVKTRHEIYLGKLWARNEGDALKLAEIVFPHRALKINRRK